MATAKPKKPEAKSEVPAAPAPATTPPQGPAPRVYATDAVGDEAKTQMTAHQRVGVFFNAAEAAVEEKRYGDAVFALGQAQHLKDRYRLGGFLQRDFANLSARIAFELRMSGPLGEAGHAAIAAALRDTE